MEGGRNWLSSFHPFIKYPQMPIGTMLDAGIGVSRTNTIIAFRNLLGNYILSK